MKYGSISHDFNGRRIKKKRPKGPVYSKMEAAPFRPLATPTGYRRDADQRQIPSNDRGTVNTMVSPSAEMKREISKQYPVAPAYNKGGYQIIPQSDLKYIGR